MRWMSCSQCRAGNAAMTTIGTSHCTCKRSLFRAHQSLQNHWAVHHTEASGCIGKLPAVQRIESCSRQLNGQFQAPFSPVVTKQISTRCRRRSTTRRSNRRKDQRVSRFLSLGTVTPVSHFAPYFVGLLQCRLETNISHHRARQAVQFISPATRLLTKRHIAQLSGPFCMRLLCNGLFPAFGLIKPEGVVPARMAEDCRPALSPAVSGTKVVRWGLRKFV